MYNKYGSLIINLLILEEILMHNVILFENETVLNELAFELIKEVMKIKRRLNYYYEFDDTDDSYLKYGYMISDQVKYNLKYKDLYLFSERLGASDVIVKEIKAHKGNKKINILILKNDDYIEALYKVLRDLLYKLVDYRGRIEKVSEEDVDKMSNINVLEFWYKRRKKGYFDKDIGPHGNFGDAIIKVIDDAVNKISS